MSEPTAQEKPIYEFMRKFVQSSWDDPNSYHKAVLLSNLGTKLKNEFGDYNAYFPKGLKDFLRTWPVLQLVQHPNVKEKIGLIPGDATIPENIISLFQGAGEKKPSFNSIIYNQDFWDAFFKPIILNRYVIFEENGRPKILNDVNQPPSGAYQIETSDVVAVDPATPVVERVAATREHLQKWLAKHSLDPEKFLRKNTTKTTELQDRLTHLKQAFEKISDEDRARILIPLDIIFKIMS